MKIVTALIVSILIAGCSNGGGSTSPNPVLLDGDSGVFDPGGSIVNACESSYYSELVGDYDGQISFDEYDGSLSCQWEVELQVSSAYNSDPNSRRICDLTFNMASDSIEKDGCADIGVGGTLLDSLIVPSTIDDWTNTPWPIDAAAQMPATLPENAVYPIGLANLPTRQFTVLFDGLGNVSFPSTNDILPKWSGVLVKQ